MFDAFLNLLAGSTTLWFAAGALLLFVIAIGIGSFTVSRSEVAEGEFRRKAALMPSFQTLEAAAAALREKRTERDELLEELRTLRQEQAEAERHRLDAQHWQSLADQAKRDYDGRQDLIDEVDRLRTAYENAAAELASRNEELMELTRERSSLAAEIETATHRLQELRDQVERVEDLTEQIEALSGRRDDLLKELNDIKDQRDERLRAAFEVEQLARRREELEQSLHKLPEEVKALEERLRTSRDELEGLRHEAERLRQLRDEIDRLQHRHVALGTEIEGLQREKARLENSVSGSSGTEVDGTDESLQIADLLQRPACLYGDDEALLLPDTIDETDESVMLSRVTHYLEELNFDFEPRVVFRFHTALKTGFISPLTVLAGISGTGKSQLPQRYAEAMGMHFLKVAVQPRWDSPQDLLGFYNYLEKSYKATEFARALVRMDPTFLPLKDDENAADRILLVLLDEMNLARVEYYFSEFLSRLEGRPMDDTSASDLLLPGRINIDVPRQGGTPLTVYPGHNVLFAGTMNEDESTQALSDKVLDRANTLRFRKPEKLRNQTLTELVQYQHSHLPFNTWMSWRRKSDGLVLAHFELTEKFVVTLNEHLAEIGRPFGHRINQAIYAYVANYPDLSDESQVKFALADTLMLRILPKLRGIELENRIPRAIGGIAALAREFLGDDELAKSIEQGLSDRDVFVWTG